MTQTLRFDGRGFLPSDHLPVDEIPVPLTVNGVPLATLMASPHDLNFLVAGFLRMQGIVTAREDILSLSACADFGVATVTIRGEVPKSLKPTVTSGCGGGISFTTPGADGAFFVRPPALPRRFTPEQVVAAFDAMGRLSDKYRERGGIHSAAVSNGESIILHAEDLGRHNTIDRIAGEAMLKGIDLAGTMLLTSGRVSSEMAVKGASLGVSLIASRTSPTSLAVRVCDERGVTLVGYARGASFSVYAHPEAFLVPAVGGFVEGVSGAVLLGGKSKRMGRDKALLPYGGRRMAEAVSATMASHFRHTAVVTNDPTSYAFLPFPMIPDAIPGFGALSGIHAALVAASTERVFVVACDMPLLSSTLIQFLCELDPSALAVIPEGERGPEPLCAVYSKSAIPSIEAALAGGGGRIVDVLKAAGARFVPKADVAAVDPSLDSFRNANTPEEYEALPGREG